MFGLALPSFKTEIKMKLIRYDQMASDWVNLARKIAIVYVIIGFSYFLLWHYIIAPTDKMSPLLQTLFYIFLPAALVLPYLICEAADEVLRGKEEATGQDMP